MIDTNVPVDNVLIVDYVAVLAINDNETMALDSEAKEHANEAMVNDGVVNEEKSEIQHIN